MKASVPHSLAQRAKTLFFIAMATPNIFQLLRRITTNYTRYNQLSTLWWKNARRYLKRSTTLWMSKLIDHTRKHIKKSLSPAQPNQLLMNPEKKDVIMKKEMLKPFERSTKTMEDLISKMTDCLTSLGDGIQTRMRFVANALAGNHSCAAVNHHTCYPTQFDWYGGGGMVSPTSYNNISSQYVPLNRRASQQLNRIGSGQARPPSAGPGPILTFAQAPIMATTNLLAPAFFSQLILLFTLTSRPCVGNGLACQ